MVAHPILEWTPSFQTVATCHVTPNAVLFPTRGMIIQPASSIDSLLDYVAWIYNPWKSAVVGRLLPGAGRVKLPPC